MYDTVTDTLGEGTAMLLGNTAEVVAAYLSNNHVQPAELPGVIASVHASLVALAGGTVSARAAPVELEVEKATPAQIRKSITPDALISFIDGKPYKTLKRHLTGSGLDPVSYRARYGLPVDYPMTAASYSEHRSALARASGLGKPGAQAERAAAAPAPAEAVPAKGRRKAA